MTNPVRECLVEKCTNDYYGRDLCKKHYMKTYHSDRNKTGVTRKPYSDRPFPVGADKIETVWQSIVQELGISGANYRRKAI